MGAAPPVPVSQRPREVSGQNHSAGAILPTSPPLAPVFVFLIKRKERGDPGTNFDSAKFLSLCNHYHYCVRTSVCS